MTDLEHDLQNAVLGWMNAGPYKMIRINSGIAKRGGRTIRMAPRGTPDLLGYEMGTGRFVAVEIETDRESQRSAERRETKAKQREFLTQVIQAGGIGITARSLDQLRKELEAQ